MRRFISKKTIKIPKYKILSIKIVSTLILLSFTYITLSILITKDNEKIIKLIGSNSFGNSLSSYNIYNNKNILFYENSFGIYPNTTKSSYNTNNIHELTLSKPLVYIYNTFQKEKYKSTSTNEYNVKSIITEASLILSEYLKKEGIKSIVELENIDDLVKEKNYTYNYLASKELLTKAQKENPTLNYFFDLQISSDSYTTSTYINEKGNYAKIKFIVGTNYSSYQENLKLATILNTKLNNKDSNLSNGISLEGGNNNEGIYNEDLNPHVLLIEIGSNDNTIEEVNRTLKVLASIIKETIYEKEKK